MATVSLTTEPPEKPDADFAVYIDFDRESGKPQRVFRALDGLISAFEKLDRALVGSIDPSIEPVLMLEDIEGGSIKCWLRDKLKATEDQALYELDWKPLVGKYLVAAKYAVVEWVNDEEETGKRGSINDLRKKILRLAHDTDVRTLGDYGVPSSEDLADAGKAIASSLSNLEPTDKAKYISEAGETSFNLSIAWDEFDLQDATVKQTITSPPMKMILAVKRPDYLGASQWDFRLGKKLIKAKITDDDWLRRFQSRSTDVRPGDALECMVEHEAKYDFDNEMISEAYTVTKVIDVLEDRFQQDDLFD